MLLLNGKTEKTLDALKTFLLNEHESKVYFTLLAIGESKPGEIVKMSGVPQSKVYWILADLMEMRLVEQTQPKPIRVKAVDLGIALEQFRSQRIAEVNKATTAKKFLEELLESLQRVKERYGGQFRIFEPNRREVRI